MSPSLLMAKKMEVVFILMVSLNQLPRNVPLTFTAKLDPGKFAGLNPVDFASIGSRKENGSLYNETNGSIDDLPYLRPAPLSPGKALYELTLEKPKEHAFDPSDGPTDPSTIFASTDRAILCPLRTKKLRLSIRFLTYSLVEEEARGFFYKTNDACCKL